MRDFKRRTRMRAIIYSPVTASMLLMLLFFVGYSTFQMAKTYFNTRAEYEAALNELQGLQEREKNLTKRIETLNTSRGKEEEIRNKFGFVKEGEEVVVIVEPLVSVTTSTTDASDGGFLSSMLESFLNIFR